MVVALKEGCWSFVFYATGVWSQQRLLFIFSKASPRCLKKFSFSTLRLFFDSFQFSYTVLALAVISRRIVVVWWTFAPPKQQRRRDSDKTDVLL